MYEKQVMFLENIKTKNIETKKKKRVKEMITSILTV